jgi:hypothetical protein
MSAIDAIQEIPELKTSPPVNQTTREKKQLVASVPPAWKGYQKIAFRIAFIYFLILCVPLYWGFYEGVFSINLSKIVYHDLQSIVAFWPPQIITIESEEGVFGLLNYINLILIFIMAVIGGLIWTRLDRKATSYHKLNYWIRVLARYRLAYGMIGWGLKKIFVMQMVSPPIGMLNTPFVNMAEKKLYWSHVGVELQYEVFLGFAEFVPGILLLFRKTSSLGAALAAVVCFNICIANHAYDAGVAVPAAYFMLIGIFIVSYDLPNIWNLVVRERDVTPYRWYPSFSKKWQQYARTGLKIAGTSIFVIGATLLWWYGWQNNHNNYNIPSTPGIAGTKGYYTVTEFRLNNNVIPYSPEDSVRWQDATFEEWSSLSYKTNRAAIADRMIGYSPLRVTQSSNTQLNQVNTQDSRRRQREGRNRDLGVTRWEVGGMAGERRYFFYKADTVNKILHLQNKNRYHRDETQVLHYERPTESRIILSGRNEFKDSIYVVLDRLDKKYPLNEGRLKEGAY